MTAKTPVGKTLMNAPPIRLETFTGEAISPYIADLARLRIDVFAAFPYLYQGSADYEAYYLEVYARSPRSLFVLAFDGDRVVGASTGVPLAEETEEVRSPFEKQGWPVETIFYFGESVLLPSYRGRGIGVGFFEAREAHARSLPKMAWCAFCAVERPADHPARPPDYVPLDAFWHKRGYRHHPELRTTMRWTDTGEDEETPKPMSFWLRAID